MSSEFNPHIILLAAGQSRRFDGIKVLADVYWQDHEYSMIELALHKLKTTKQAITVATGSYHDELTDTGERAQSDNSDVSHYQCSKAHLGLGHTIAQATEYVDKRYSPSHIMFVLTDQVALSTNIFNQLLSLAEQHPENIISCHTSKGFCVPCVFPVTYFNQLKQLSGDKGAKAILMTEKAKVITIDAEEALVDIDFQHELKNWNDNNNNSQRGQA